MSIKDKAPYHEHERQLPAIDEENELPLARTAYNYMRSYPNLEAVPLCASVPAAEAFSADYSALVARSSLEIAQNFYEIASVILAKELANDSRWWRLSKLLADLETMSAGLTKVSEEALAQGPIAFLKSALWDLLRPPGNAWIDPNFLQATSTQDYADLIRTLRKPQMLTIPHAEWMPDPEFDGQLQCQQDWFFGFLQVAGFNTTNLRGVVGKPDPERPKALVWSELSKKIALTDDMLQAVLGDGTTVQQAIDERALFACDYTCLLGADGVRTGKESDLHGKHRYMPAPIALFYWSSKPVPGFPPSFGSAPGGVLRPIAIQLDGDEKTIFLATAKIDDNRATTWRGGDGTRAVQDFWSWQIAKYFVNVACAIQHESVAHLGECHFIMESVTVATHRQLGQQHAVHRLLAPHMRFTLSINGGALANLVVPGGVVATNVGPHIDWTLRLVNEARQTWTWKDNNPESFFKRRGLDSPAAPLIFPFRDDTMLLWFAIKDFVGAYVEHTYPTDKSMTDDAELDAWLEELWSPTGAGFQDLEKPATLAELIQLISHIIYIAGPLHASVNYGQYPLGAFMPSVAATIYKAAPTADNLATAASYISWFPPLDVALYTLSFEYLLSSVQYDRLGHYAANPQFPHFDDPELQAALVKFQEALAAAETTILKSNGSRPMPYVFQQPSRVPNSISI
jgi:arachidonate 15-lipoxygenase